MNDKYTEWYQGTIKPVRKGVYQRQDKGWPWYSYWDGKVWRSTSTQTIAERQSVEWRGLTTKDGK